MLVNLRNGWFAPDGAFYDPAENPHLLPDNWEKLLPSTAEKTTTSKTVEVERLTANNTPVVQTQSIDGDVAKKNLDGKAGDDKAPQEVSIPDMGTVKVPKS